MGSAQQNDPVIIGFPPASDAERLDFVNGLVDVVNKAYAETEREMFVTGYQRTTPTEVADLIRTGQLVTATRDPTGEPVGCVSLKAMSPTRSAFGMLALGATYQGSGLGRKLIQFVEEHSRVQGCEVMQLELLVPTTWEHPFKTRMNAWYSRLGYQLVKVGQFDKDYPALAPLLSGPADYRISEKSLV
ncbi:hypothetical protein VDGE_01075 [Verticillium dahliae]|uniref:N-acetyltransferase domain-containing protein n=1 Tax=Verticillium dahliae TaxID=27337 RepID=A0A444S9X4_VERDA|nr:hypothetical protein VDGE_01075 [Verticillium dahliae]